MLSIRYLYIAMQKHRLFFAQQISDSKPEKSDIPYELPHMITEAVQEETWQTL
jgi:hypothetical protein